MNPMEPRGDEGSGVVFHIHQRNDIKRELETIPGKNSIDSLILGTSHIIRKVLQCEA